MWRTKFIEGGGVFSPNRGRRRSVVCSHGDRQGLESFFGDRQVILFENGNVEPDRFANIVDRFLSRAALTDATGETEGVGHPIPVFAFENNGLSHLSLW